MICPTCGQEVRQLLDRQRGTLGYRVYAERVAHGWSLREAGEQWGISFSSLSRIERGEGPKAQTFVKLIGILKLSPEEIAGLFPEKSS